MIEKDSRADSNQKFNGIVVPYLDRKDSVISIVKLIDPYGPGTSPVVSIGSSLKAKPEAPTWKIHIPLELVEEVTQAMLKICKDS